MQITESPVRYAPAYRDAIFKISAAVDEIVNLDIYDHTGSNVIGKKRVSGATSHEINVANYAKRQLDIVPADSSVCAFVSPGNRVVDLTLKSGNVVGTARLTAGLETYAAQTLLSKAPAVKNISPGERDELSFITPGGQLTARLMFSGVKKDYAFAVASAQVAEGLVSFCLDMKDMVAKLLEAGGGDVEDYHTMEVEINCAEEAVIRQSYRIVPAVSGSVRMCWWNYYGQVDYYTMRSAVQKTIGVSKQRIYASDGYKTIGSAVEASWKLVSEYETEGAMEWLAEMAAAPRVWIAQDGVLKAVDVLTSRVMTRGEQLAKLILEIRPPQEISFQHL